MLKVKLLDPQKKKTQHGNKWQGAFVSEFIVGLFIKENDQETNIINHKRLNNSTQDINENTYLKNLKAAIGTQIDLLEKQSIENSNTFEDIPNTRDINFDLGPITSAKSTGVEYKPELTIIAGEYRIVWPWTVNCTGSTPNECSALPQEVTLIHQTKETQNIEPENNKYSSFYKTIKTSIGDMPENIVIRSLLDKIKYI